MFTLCPDTWELWSNGGVVEEFEAWSEKVPCLAIIWCLKAKKETIIVSKKHLLTVYHAREHFIKHFCNHWICLLILLWLVVMNHALRVDYKYFSKRHTNFSIAYSIRVSISKSTIEWRMILWEYFENVSETGNLKHLWFSKNNFPIKRA